ncbi:unnamed protein product [Rotaria magnacalcarata]|uniref:Palmitoyltransferase n=3 Tax=Rotaria magnacalcarata TaxID=392030 RepID=A0A815MLC9_9BILA|nr:unnamed protein product [Rotaria magnacalcarata]CAF1424845.1 unnamed protein product [Rotaria magnacalcarata]CAF1929399.1 unnamed protein product [Rotaria magnacalcarata]
MNNNQIRPQLSPQDAAAMLAQLQQQNPQAYARLQAMRPELMETGNEHLLNNALAASASGHGHGHGHTHSSSCSHSQAQMHFSQPVPEPPPKPDPTQMSIVQAVQYNEIERVKQLIESGQVDVNTPDQEGCYLLHWAAINNHIELIRYLIAKGATVDLIGGDLKSTPLHWACRQGCTEAFFLLVDNGAAIKSADVNGVQPIHIAAQYGQIKILAYLLGSGVDVDCVDERGFTPLMYSCIGPSSGYVPLPNSSHVCCTQFLLTFGADVNHQEPTRHYSALHFSINNQNPISFHSLLKHPQINIHVKNGDNFDPLIFARMRQNSDAVAQLERRIQSTKAHIKPVFLQRYLVNAGIRKWLTRFFMLFIMTLIGLSVNSYEHSYWLRILFPIVVIFLCSHLFSYYVLEAKSVDHFAFAYVISSSVLMYITYWIYLQEPKFTISDIIYHFSTVYGLYCVRCIKTLNPGFIKQQNMTLEGNSLTKEKICIAFARDPRWTLDHFCVTCLIRRPLRSKHCPVDGSCVAKFDHHCTWLNACIGGRNYFYFVRVLTFGTIALIIWMCKALHLIFDDFEQYSIKYLLTQIYDPWFIYMLMLTAFNAVWVTLMTSFHLINAVFLGVTLNERLTGFRYSYFRDENTGKRTNPFQRQKFKNFLETFGLFRLMSMCRYTRIDWSQVYDINQISGAKMN